VERIAGWTVSNWRPSYLELGVEEIASRAREALPLLGEERCLVCPRLCRVGRLNDQKGLCAIGRQAVVASHFPHFGEENCLRGWNGSGTIFFSGCNLRCVFCCSPGTLIATEHGPRPIEEIFSEAGHEVGVGDGQVRRPQAVRVYTLTGELAPVSKAFRHHYSGALIRVKPMNAPEFRLTPNHQVFAVRRSSPAEVVKIPAGELTSDHYLVVPKRAHQKRGNRLDVAAVLSEHPPRFARRTRRVETSRLVEALRSSYTSAEVGRDLGYHPAYVRTLRSRLKRQLWDGTEHRPLRLQIQDGLVRFDGEHSPGIPRELFLDESLAWLLGLFCAEGHVAELRRRPNSFRLIFSLGPQEQALTERASRILNETFGVRPQIVERRTTVTVEVGKSSLAVLFRALGGTGARTKRVPRPVFESPEEVVRAFLEGYLAGDGWAHATHLVGTTASVDLAHGLYELGLRLDVLPSIHRWDPPAEKVIEGRRVQQSTLWFVKLKRDRLERRVLSNERTRWKDAGAHFLVPIHRIEREPYDGYVYNLEVDHPTHSYLVPAVAIANCQNYDISWEVQGERVTPTRLAEMMLELQGLGCHNINFVTPEHVVPQILEGIPLAVAGGLSLPIVYNTSSYDSLDSLQFMEGIVDIYMPDFKVATGERARRYLRKPDYPEVARHAIKEMNRQVGPLRFDSQGLARRGLLLRHLMMPGMLDETETILRFVAEELGPDTYVDLMAQYYPAGLVGKPGRDGYEEINRHIWRDEYLEAAEIAERLGLRRLDVRSLASGYRLEESPQPNAQPLSAT
jgi:putative pyruvate formate lyase activating enzyme